MMKLVAIAAVLVTVAFAAEGPHGCTCGVVPLLITNVKLCIESSTIFNMSANWFGKNITCAQEKYAYSPPSSITLPDWGNSNDCLTSHTGLSQPPSINYDATTNAISMYIGLGPGATVELDLSPCP